MTEEELNAKAKELEEREGELSKKEEILNERETKLAEHEADAGKIAEAIKEQYEKKIEALKAEYEDKIKRRDDVITQLASGDTPTDDDSPFAELNKRRIAQRSA